MTKLKTHPKSTLIESTAASLAAQYFEIGMSEGLKSKHANHKEFAIANMERFIPHAVSILLDMLHDPATTVHMKDEIVSAFDERRNDPDYFILNEKIQPFKEKKASPILIKGIRP